VLCVAALQVSCWPALYPRIAHAPSVILVVRLTSLVTVCGLCPATTSLRNLCAAIL